MIIPRLVFQQGRWLGLALANPASTDAKVTLTAYKLDGTLFTGGEVTNPATVTIPKGSQYVNVGHQIFLNPPRSAVFSPDPTRLWIDVTSDTSGLTGFFLEGDDALTYLDGGELAGNGTDLMLPIVENTGSGITELSLVNPSTQAVQATIQFLRSNGTSISSIDQTVPAKGSLQGPLSSLFNISYADVASIRIRSSSPVVCYGSIFRQSDPSLIIIPAEDVTAPAKTLYFPQLAQGDAWATSVGISNLSFTDKTLVTITAYQPDGTLFTSPAVQQNPVTQEILPGGVFRSSLKNLFGFASSPLQTGWIKVEAAAPTINGFVEYGAGSTRALVTAQLTPYQRSTFSYQVTSAGYYTGLAVLNPGSLTANIEVYSLKADGSPLGKTQRVFKPGQKEARLLQEWVPAAAAQAAGWVFVRSDHPIIATQLFGTDSYAALANVPPQEVTTDFAPNPATKVTTIPPLVVLESGKSQQFTAPGMTNLKWSVNGDSTAGTISNTGLYQAPALTPAKRTVSIQATTAAGDLSGGSSIDVVRRDVLTGGLTLVSSVAYLESLNRFFIAEQQLVSSAPSEAQAPGTSNAQISEVLPGGSTAPFIAAIQGDTIAKMLPLVDSGVPYLILAGIDSGKLYRLNVSTKALTTVASGLNKPNSLALDPGTGNLLVSESGANRITSIPRSQVLTDPQPPGANAPAAPGNKIAAALTVNQPLGIASSTCNGAVYYTLADGTLHELLGSRDRVLDNSVTPPGQIQVLYRDGFPCSDGITLVVVESNFIGAYYPKSESSIVQSVVLLSGLQSPRDITFFPKGNPFVSGGEASIGLAESPSGSGSSRITDVAVGGMFQNVPSQPIKTGTGGGGNLPYSDPVGDTFFTAESSGLPVPDIISVNAYTLGGSSIITIRLADSVTTLSSTSADGVIGYIFLNTGGAGQPQQLITDLVPFQDSSTLTFDALVDITTGLMISFGTQFGETQGTVTAVGNTISISIPSTALDLGKSSCMIMIGNNYQPTDIAPNGGYLRLGP